MALEKPTPGPWRVDPTHPLCIESAKHGNVGIVNLARASEADAALMARSPDLLAENADLHEQVAALQSREVCTRPHEDVETCGYCQRDALNDRVKALEIDNRALTNGLQRIEDGEMSPALIANEVLNSPSHKTLFG